MSMLHKRHYGAGYVPRFQKTYLSREMTRSMALEHPIGDPHGGPAYGERNDPISAIISIGTMFTASAGFTVGLASMSLASGLMFAGGALSLLGNITGNKTLSKIGMVVGIAGGIGSLFDIGTSTTVGEMFGLDKAAPTTGAPGTALTNTPTTEWGADVSQGIVNSQPVGASLGPDNIDVGGGFNPATGGASAPAPALSNSPVDAAFSAQTATGLNVVPGDSGTLTSALSNTASTGGPAAPSVATPGAPNVSADAAGFTARTATGLPAVPGDSAAVAGPNFLDSLKAGNVGDAAKAAWGGVKDMGKSWLELSKTNPAVALMMGQTISSVADVISGKAGAQVDALEAQGQLSREQANKLRFEMEEYKRKIAQQNSNYANVANPLATWTPPTPQGYTPPSPAGGIIGGAMKPPGG